MEKVRTNQYVKDGVLIIKPVDDATDWERRMFAVGSTPIQPNEVFYPTEDKHEFYTEHRGPWTLLYKLKGLAIEKIYKGDNVSEVRIHGVRSLDQIKQCGYQVEGRVRVYGKRYRAFTTSMLFETEGNKLHSVSYLYVCSFEGDR